jgi:4-hydroxyphenylpyruvate dioxygenase-like putative hemolysin
MEKTGTGIEELAFKTAELDAAMREAGFHLAFSDPEAMRDLGYRARYIRSKSTMHPLLNANLEYYHAVKAFSLKISTTDEQQSRTYEFLAKNHGGDIKELLNSYFSAMRKGLPLKIEGKKHP